MAPSHALFSTVRYSLLLCSFSLLLQIYIVSRYALTASENFGEFVNPHDLNSGQNPRYTHSGTQQEATSGSTLAISSTTFFHAARVSGEACEQRRRLEMNMTACALAKHSCTTGASCVFSVRSSPVLSLLCVDTKCSMPYL